MAFYHKGDVAQAKRLEHRINKTGRKPMTDPRNKTHLLTLIEVVRDGLAKDCSGCCLDNSHEVRLVAEYVVEVVREYLDPPGPEVFKHPSKPRKAPIVRDEMAEHDPWDS